MLVGIPGPTNICLNHHSFQCVTQLPQKEAVGNIRERRGRKRARECFQKAPIGLLLWKSVTDDSSQRAVVEPDVGAKLSFSISPRVFICQS